MERNKVVVKIKDIRDTFTKRVRSFQKNTAFYKKLVFVVGFLALWWVIFSDFKGKLSLIWPASPWWVVVSFCLGTALVALAIVGIYYLAKKRQWGFDKIFLVFAILFGSLYIFIAPLGSGNDDKNHYYRVYEISHGQLVSDIDGENVGSKLPMALSDLFGEKNEKKVYSAIPGMYSVQENNNEKKFYEYANTVLYSPISYIPQTLGMLAGRAADASPFWLGMFARVFNLAFYILICFIGFKLMPRFKLFFLILLLSPSIISNATTLSADAFLVALVFLFVALVLYLKEKKKKISWKYATIFGILSILIAGCKITYLPVVLLVLLFGKDNFKSKIGRVSFKTVCIALGLSIGIIWMKIASGLLNAHYVLASEQMSHVLHHPLQFLVVFMRTMMTEIVSFMENIFSTGSTFMYGSKLKLYSFIMIAFIIVAILAIFNEKKKSMLSKRERLFFVLISAAIVLAIAGALYTQWTPQNCGNAIGCSLIVGIQGRYFIPVVIIGVSAIGNVKRHISKDKVFLSFLALQLLTMTAMVTAFLG